MVSVPKVNMQFNDPCKFATSKLIRITTDYCILMQPCLNQIPLEPELSVKIRQIRII